MKKIYAKAVIYVERYVPDDADVEKEKEYLKNDLNYDISSNSYVTENYDTFFGYATDTGVE